MTNQPGTPGMNRDDPLVDAGRVGSVTIGVGVAGTMAATVAGPSVAIAGQQGGRKRARIKKSRRLGVRSALSTFASHLAPPAHPDVGVVHLRPPLSGSASTSSGSMSSRSNLARTYSSQTAYIAGHPPIHSHPHHSHDHSHSHSHPHSHSHSHFQGSNGRPRATSGGGGGGGWMLADDAQYRNVSLGRSSTRDTRRYPAYDEEDDEDEDKDEGVVEKVVVDGSFGPVRRGSVDSTEYKTQSGNEETASLTSSASITTSSKVAAWIRDQILVPILHYADSRFPDKRMERQFTRERWVAEKSSAMLAACFLVVQFILFAALQGMTERYHYYSYIGIAGFFTVPLPFMVGFNGPRRFQWLYQPFVLMATWNTGYLQTIEMHRCGFKYGSDSPMNTCGSRLYLYMFGLLFGLPTIASIGLWGQRVLTVSAAAAYMIMSMVMFVPDWNWRQPFIRQPICLLLYHIYISLWSYWRERADRQIFLLRHQLRTQYSELQTAQTMERRAEHSKKQFVSYIFHEVRVPLNTAMLAVQNLEGEGVFRQLDEDQGVMVHGLTSSLGMMEKVLNDVLSFNRMESGQLTQARKPFDFHKSVRVVAFAHRGQADATHVEFSIELDPRIDKLGLLVGDEMRLRQITSNLVSNALKFTREGSVAVVTRLIAPVYDRSKRDSAFNDFEDDDDALPFGPDGPPSDATAGTGTTLVVDKKAGIFGREKDKESDVEMGLGAGVGLEHVDDHSEKRHPGERERLSNDEKRLSFNADDTTKKPNRNSVGTGFESSASRRSRAKRFAIVRVEVRDTGPGLRNADLRDNRLFSPYVQTEIGRRQGGKGSGLGLALVMQLIKISGGRLGVESKFGGGSTFWFELQYPIFDAPLDTVPPSPTSGFTYPTALERPPSTPRRRYGSFASAPSDGVGLGPTERRQSAPEAGRGSPADARVRLGSVAERASSLLSEAEDDGGDEVGEGRNKRPRAAAPVSTTHTSAPASALVQVGSDTPPVAASLAATPTESPLWAQSWALNSTSARAGVSSGPGTPSPQPRLAPRQGSRPTTLAVFPSSPQTVTTVISSSSPTTTPLPPLPATLAPPLPSTVALSSSAQSTPPLPTLPLPRPNASRTKTNSANRLGSGLAALVVDDDTLTRRLMSRMLTRLGAEVSVADNGQSALQAIEGREFDVVFLDNQMPLMSGVEAVRALRSGGSELFVVGCTGNALEEDQHEYRAAGANAILTKPVHQHDMEAKLVEARERKVKRETAGVGEEVSGEAGGDEVERGEEGSHGR